MIEVPAPAKINLHLHVTGRRPDGYHLLDSLVAFADVGDTLRLAPSHGYRLTVDGPFASHLADTAVEANLVTKAARALADQLSRPLDVEIRLTKVLPIASGIGGGSADAAATLRGLCQLWDVSADPTLLLPIAQRLGQDVPACLNSTPAQFVGIGDILRPSPALPSAWLVLASPNVALPTPDVFAQYRWEPMVFSHAAPLELVHDFHALIDALRQRRNDLQRPAMALKPEIGDVLDALTSSKHCGLARMSGSGATCFGLFPSAASAHHAMTALARARPQWWVAPAAWASRSPEGD